MEGPNSKFLRVQCTECKGEQDVFGNASSEVKCKKCGNVLIKPTGGKAQVLGKIVKVM